MSQIITKNYLERECALRTGSTYGVIPLNIGSTLSNYNFYNMDSAKCLTKRETDDLKTYHPFFTFNTSSITDNTQLVKKSLVSATAPWGLKVFWTDGGTGPAKLTIDGTTYDLNFKCNSGPGGCYLPIPSNAYINGSISATFGNSGGKTVRDGTTIRSISLTEVNPVTGTGTITRSNMTDSGGDSPIGFNNTACGLLFDSNNKITSSTAFKNMFPDTIYTNTL